MSLSTAPHATQNRSKSRRWLLLAGAVAGAILFGMFLLGFLSLLGSGSAVSVNWLIVLFNLNFRPDASQGSALSVVSGLDISLMLMFGLVMASMYPALKSASKAWAAVAVALPFLGVPIFLATGTAGRSAVLMAGLISSILAFRSDFGSSPAAIAGIVASAFLLILGDFGTAAFAPSILLALSLAAGYVLWTVWLLLVTVELARRARIAAA
jgi:hypothetical protein